MPTALKPDGEPIPAADFGPYTGLVNRIIADDRAKNPERLKLLDDIRAENDAKIEKAGRDAIRACASNERKRKARAFLRSNWQTLSIVTAILIAAALICATMIALTPDRTPARHYRR